MNASIGANILVVDDDTRLLALLSDTLTAIGYRVTPAADGAVALEYLKQGQFDLVIADIKMPGIDGLQLFKKVRRHFPETPVLIIAGSSRDMISSISSDGFLTKPFRISQIEELIENTLAAKAGERLQRRRKVLIVDSDRALRQALSTALSESRYVPFSVGDSGDALRELEKGEFDAVISDDRLAVGNSRLLLKRIGGEYPSLPVILTGDGEPEAESMTVETETPVRGYLKKPIDTRDMIELLNRVATVPLGGN
jgi:DNA-binding NtrC family response regulator